MQRVLTLFLSLSLSHSTLLSVFFYFLHIVPFIAFLITKLMGMQIVRKWFSWITTTTTTRRVTSFFFHFVSLVKFQRQYIPHLASVNQLRYRNGLKEMEVEQWPYVFLSLSLSAFFSPFKQPLAVVSQLSTISVKQASTIVLLGLFVLKRS